MEGIRVGIGLGKRGRDRFEEEGKGYIEVRGVGIGLRKRGRDRFEEEG